MIIPILITAVAILWIIFQFTPIGISLKKVPIINRAMGFSGIIISLLIIAGVWAIYISYKAGSRALQTLLENELYLAIIIAATLLIITLIAFYSNPDKFKKKKKR